jgi:hypothetical protein
LLINKDKMAFGMSSVTIVKKGWGDEVIKTSREAGAQGGTLLFGRGGFMKIRASLA